MIFADLMQSKHAEEAEERVAIMQYHGGMDRKEAEFQAAKRIVRKYKLFEQSELFS